MATIETLTSTTFSGRRFTKKQLLQIQETVQLFPNLSRKELAFTICEHLNWKNPGGKLKINSCLTMLEKLEELNIVCLPDKRKAKKPVHHIPVFEKNYEELKISDSLEAIAPIKLKQIISKEERNNFKAYLQTYHYLGYKHPFGSYLSYFIISEPLQQKLGCLLFSASAAWALAPRDKWIGWEKKHRRKLLHFIISNDRFLIFPWIDVSNLASHVLSLATKKIGDDWLNLYGYRPVLIETYVDTNRYSAVSDQASNWLYLGETQGRGHDPNHENKKSRKAIYVYPLSSDWQKSLTTGYQRTELKKRYRNDVQASHTRFVDENFVHLWKNVVHLVQEIAAQYDDKWSVRKRTFDSMLLMLLIFRLVSSRRNQSYGTVLDELWDSCQALNVPLPQKQSAAPSSFCVARKKLDEEVFRKLNMKLLQAYAIYTSKGKNGKPISHTWNGHRLFAIDGSKLNLPRELKKAGYATPSKIAHYPQGLLSCLYELKSRLPFDFELVAHGNERVCAMKHLRVLHENDVVVYDRGYLSYVMLHRHCKTGIHAIFRLPENSFTVIQDFIKSDEIDKVVTIIPSDTTRHDIQHEYPDLQIIPLQMRLLKYTIGESIFYLGTTLVAPDQRYPLQSFMDCYFLRWRIEELYKISKEIFDVEDFHAKSERGVKQELYAHFSLITMNRLFANEADSQLNGSKISTSEFEIDDTVANAIQEKSPKRIQTNFKNCTHIIAEKFESLVMEHAKLVDTVQNIFQRVIRRHHKERPGRSYPRKSMRPESKWRSSNKKKSKLAEPAMDPSSDSRIPAFS